jgi:hypothetical protein
MQYENIIWKYHIEQIFIRISLLYCAKFTVELHPHIINIIRAHTHIHKRLMHIYIYIFM